jgi:hypothetical protein
MHRCRISIIQRRFLVESIHIDVSVNRIRSVILVMTTNNPHLPDFYTPVTFLFKNHLRWQLYFLEKGAGKL